MIKHLCLHSNNWFVWQLLAVLEWCKKCAARLTIKCFPKLFVDPNTSAWCIARVAFAHFASCSCRHTSVTTRYRHWHGAVLCPGWSHLCKSKASSSLLHMANHIPVCEGWLCMVCSNRWSPFPPSCQGGSSLYYKWITRFISSLTLQYLYYSITLEMGSSRMPFP